MIPTFCSKHITARGQFGGLLARLQMQICTLTQR